MRTAKIEVYRPTPKRIIKFVFRKQHLLHPIASHRAFKYIQFQVELNNERIKIKREVELYGHPLLTGSTTT